MNGARSSRVSCCWPGVSPREKTPHDPKRAGRELEADLIAYCKSRLSTIKCPRSIDFEAELPRTPTGKLVKRHLRDKYWPKAAAKI